MMKINNNVARGLRLWSNSTLLGRVLLSSIWEGVSFMSKIKNNPPTPLKYILCPHLKPPDVDVSPRQKLSAVERKITDQIYRGARDEMWRRAGDYAETLLKEKK